MKVVRLAAILFLAFAAAASGQVRSWVSPTGLDANPCTRELPCRTFAAGIGAVASNGEVVAMESGGYGPVIITKSVTLLAPRGVHAAIAPVSGIAIAVSAGGTDRVNLRNLYLNAQGASVAIDADTVLSLSVENCIINGFTSHGILFDPATTYSRLLVVDGAIRRSSIGILATGGTEVEATVESVRLHGNVFGIQVSSISASIRNTLASGGSFGFVIAPFSIVAIEDSVATGNRFGIDAGGGTSTTVTRCAVTLNTMVGIRAGGTASVIYVSDSTISGNELGVSAVNTGSVLSRSNNTLAGNNVDGSFSFGYMAN